MDSGSLSTYEECHYFSGCIENTLRTISKINKKYRKVSDDYFEQWFQIGSLKYIYILYFWINKWFIKQSLVTFKSPKNSQKTPIVFLVKPVFQTRLSDFECRQHTKIEPGASDQDNEYLYDSFGYFDDSNQGHVLWHIDQIRKQKEQERNFVAIIQIWLRKLMFGSQKEQINKNYLDLSTFHYPHTKQYLDFVALELGSIDRTKSLPFKEILIIILLILDYFRKC